MRWFCLRYILTHWGFMAHTCVRTIVIISYGNGLGSVRRQTIHENNAQFWPIEVQNNMSEMYLKIVSVKWRSLRPKWGISLPAELLRRKMNRHVCVTMHFIPLPDTEGTQKRDLKSAFTRDKDLYIQRPHCVVRPSMARILVQILRNICYLLPHDLGFDPLPWNDPQYRRAA